MSYIFYNNLNERNLTLEVVRQIRETKTWIKACNLLFDDSDIRVALIDALSRGVALFILTNLEGATGEVFINKFSGKRKSAKQTTQDLLHSSSIKSLYDAGAHISGLDGLHAKFLLTDANCGIITSLNFTPNSINKISELGVKLGREEYDELEEVFDYIFLRPDRYRFASYDSHFTYERPSEEIDCDQLSRMSRIKMTLAKTSRGKSEALADCDIHDLRNEIFDIIKFTESGEDLYLATYSLEPNAKDADGVSLGKHLLDAKRRGVRLHIVMREEKKQVIKGIHINYHKDNHAKAVLTPRRGIIFTGNLTTESFESGFDLGVCLTPDQITETITFINKLKTQS